MNPVDERLERPGTADDGLPNPLPRPPGELERLQAAWRAPSGWRFISIVNNSYVGIFYVGASFLFFILAGILALIMRAQLAVPENDLVGHNLYNQLFTMHGTMMMFLFAVPAVEAAAVYLLPNIQGARDLPFPRLGAFGFWIYLIGGLGFFASIFFDAAPRDGWFMYPPLSSFEFSPGLSADMWLLGIGFVEIAAIIGAIEIIVGVLKTRAPGQSLDKIPPYAWAMLVFAVMVIFAFPAVITCTLLLEFERAFQWPFFIAEKGGDPLLWQHLFWFFGHPEVYIIFLPATGFVSMIVPTMAQTPLVGYRLVVLAIIATGFLSFGLWVHHMYATGIPQLSLSFFSAASFAVAVPSGIQVFAWIVTIARGNLRLDTPALFILGFLFIFTFGGLTGVMVASVPFDWQAHDTYFVVAHLHYVLIGGMVFPLFAAFYYWVPAVSERRLSERLGKWTFWLMFIGTNVTFAPMHITGLIGMPRRQYTFLPELGWNDLNLLSTIGAFTLAAGVLVFIVDLILNFRPFRGRSAGNVWNAGTLEWVESGDAQFRSIPIVKSRQPLWDQENLERDMNEGRYFLAANPTGGRETLVTSPIHAQPQYVLCTPGPTFLPLLAALFTAGVFFSLVLKLVILALLSGAVALWFMLLWAWDTDKGHFRPPIDIGGGIRLPVYQTGPQSHSWWSTVTTLLVAGSLYACFVFSYFFLWTVNPGAWPPPGVELRPWLWPIVSASCYLGSSVFVMLAGRNLSPTPGGSHWPTRIALILALPLVVAGLGFDIYGHLSIGVAPTGSGYGAIVWGLTTLQGFYVFVCVVLGLYCLARSSFGLMDGVRRATCDNTMLFWHYATGQALVGLAISVGFPRLLG